MVSRSGTITRNSIGFKKVGESRKLRKAMLGLLTGLLLLVICRLPDILRNHQAHQEQRDLISTYVYEPEDPGREEQQEPASAPATETAKTPMDRICDFAGLKKINPEIIGWIYVPGTQIDAPICKGSDDSFYLTHSFQKSSSVSGAIFVPKETSESLGDAHTIIYGHNMRSGQMFGELSNYAERDFWEQYPYVYIYTPEQSVACTIYAAYRTKYDSEVYTVGYQTGTESYCQWVEQTLARPLYDSGVVPDGQEQIFTLSTCADSGSALDRFVVQCVVTGRKSNCPVKASVVE